MTARARLEQIYSTRDGLVVPDKDGHGAMFTGQPLWVVYFWELWLDRGNETSHSNAVLEVRPEDIAEFPELEGTRMVVLETGFDNFSPWVAGHRVQEHDDVKESRRIIRALVPWPLLIGGMIMAQPCEPPYIDLPDERACNYERPDNCRWKIGQKPDPCENECYLICVVNDRVGAGIDVVERPAINARGTSRPIWCIAPNGPTDGGRPTVDWGPGGRPAT